MAKERSMVGVICEVQLKNRRAKDLMLCVENNGSVGYEKQWCWYAHVLRKDNGHVFRRAVELEVEKDMGEVGGGGKHKVVLSREDVLCQRELLVLIRFSMG